MVFERRWWWVIGMIASVVAVGVSVLSWDNARVGDLSPRFHWPDETAHGMFASRVARGESFTIPEPRNVAVGNFIHPRSVNVRADGALVPGSYLGLPLAYGVIGRVFGDRAMLFVTPFLTAALLVVLALLVARTWGWSIALTSVALLALHPSLWMFSATALLPNVPFVALALVGFAVLVGDRNRQSQISNLKFYLRWLLGGLLLGLALTMRTHELMWVAAIAGAIAWRVRPGWRACIAGAIGAALPFIPILILNAQLYGSPFTTGYALLQENGALPTEFVSGGGVVGILRALLAPFGWHPAEALARFWEYMVVPFPWFIALAATGLMHALLSWRLSTPTLPPHTVGREGKGGQGFALATLALVVWLMLYYGSWTLADPLVRATNVLTISYARYWLPIVVLLAPWAAIGFLTIVRRAGRWGHTLAAIVLLSIALSSSWQVVRDPLEGLLRQRQAIAEHRVRIRAVIAATPADAVIISHRMDKVFAPERAVVYAPEVLDEDFTRRLTALLGVAPVYWYAPSVPMLTRATLELVGDMPFDEFLYRVRPL